MNINRRLILIAAVLATRTDVAAAAARLLAEGYCVRLVGPTAPIVAASWVREGRDVQADVRPLANVLLDVTPAVAVSDTSDADVGLNVPNRLVLGQPAGCPHPRTLNVPDLDAWAVNYLSPRIPRLFPT